MVIVSPYAKVAYTDAQPATFASVLRFAEEIEILAPEAPRAERLDAAAIRTAGDDFAVAPAEPEETHARW